MVEICGFLADMEPEADFGLQTLSRTALSRRQLTKIRQDHQAFDLSPVARSLQMRIGVQAHAHSVPQVSALPR
jgi:hypothetical protein